MLNFTEIEIDCNLKAWKFQPHNVIEIRLFLKNKNA